MFSKNRNKIKLNHILLAILPGLIVAGFWGFANSNPKTIFDESRLPESVMVIDANDSQKRTVIAANPPEVEEPEWQCGDEITFNYRDSEVKYGTVYNSTTSKCWMDRNLGATKVAEAYNDCVSYPSNCSYGDLLQWGRLDDNHQNRTSDTTLTLSNTNNPNHSDFILNSSSPYDWRNPQNNNLWQGDGGINDPCPSGWRVPTADEWYYEYKSWSSENRVGAYNSPLKVTTGGLRYYSTGLLNGVNTEGYYWSSSVAWSDAYQLYFGAGFAVIASVGRAEGGSVRCVQD